MGSGTLKMIEEAQANQERTKPTMRPLDQTNQEKDSFSIPLFDSFTIGLVSEAKY